MYKKIWTKRGQITVEYMVLAAAAISLFIVFFRPSGIFDRAYTETLESGTSSLQEMMGRLTSRDDSLGPSGGAPVDDSVSVGQNRRPIPLPPIFRP